MYDPSIGRWIEEDPAGFEAGDANLTRYVMNRPTLLMDPSGLQGKQLRIAYTNNENRPDSIVLTYDNVTGKEYEFYDWDDNKKEVVTRKATGPSRMGTHGAATYVINWSIPRRRGQGIVGFERKPFGLLVGYIVQEVYLKVAVVSGVNRQPVARPNNDEGHFWEAWAVYLHPQLGFWVGPGNSEDLFQTIDEAEKTAGIIVANGKATMILAADYDTEAKFTDAMKDFRTGADGARGKRGTLLAHGLPSTNKKPDWCDARIGKTGYLDRTMSVQWDDIGSPRIETKKEVSDCISRIVVVPERPRK